MFMLIYLIMSCKTEPTSLTILTNSKPIAYFSILPDSGNTSTIFLFDASGSYDKEDSTSLLEFRWDWNNDGIWDTDYSHNLTENHQFSEAGIKTINLEVKDTFSLTDSVSGQLNVKENTYPIAVIIVTPTEGDTTTLFKFDASNSYDKEDSVSALQVKWDWENDGIWDTEYSHNLVEYHKYAIKGQITIKLQVTDTGGLSDNEYAFVNTDTIKTGNVIDIDGNEYRTIRIGTQWWMAENLKVTQYNDGSDISNITNGEEWDNATSAAYCVYNNDNDNVAIYGLLYNWYVINSTHNIAPLGWHVPTDEEWKVLEKSLGMSDREIFGTGHRGEDEGDKLKSTSGWINDCNGNNSSGFNALPGGYRGPLPDVPGYFFFLGERTYFWSSTEWMSEHSQSYYRGLFLGSTIIREPDSKILGYSIRGVKD